MGGGGGGEPCRLCLPHEAQQSEAMCMSVCGWGGGGQGGYHAGFVYHMKHNTVRPCVCVCVCGGGTEQALSTA